jgi:WD40 repeat protein
MTPKYEPEMVLRANRGAITALQFSPDGSYLASGGDDGVLSVFSIIHWQLIKTFIDTSSVSAVTWHPSVHAKLFCGFRSGDVHTVEFRNDMVCVLLNGLICHYTATRDEGAIWCGQTPARAQYIV